MKTYVYKTADYGKTWTPLATDALAGYAHVVRQDLVNPDLLFLGTEFGLYVSVDGGARWARFTGRLPEGGGARHRHPPRATATCSSPPTAGASTSSTTSRRCGS